jgi:pyruvate/2-oxoglutarate dehydrogenase complex dihydrolipoamide dehydrogenase (E3) component
MELNFLQDQNHDKLVCWELIHRVKHLWKRQKEKKFWSRDLTFVGIKTNIENIGLEEVGIATDKDKILVNAYNPGYYAIGDVSARQ